MASPLDGNPLKTGPQWLSISDARTPRNPKMPANLTFPMAVHLTSYHQTVLSHTSEKQKSKQGLWGKCHLRTCVYILSLLLQRKHPSLPQLQHACFLTANLTNAYQTARWHHIITWRQAWSHKGTEMTEGGVLFREELKPFLPHSRDSREIN